MEIWMDSADKNAIQSACRFGFINGVTTNPSILAEVNKDHEKVINTLLDIQDGPVAVQVTAQETEDIISRTHSLHAFSDRILVKIPVTTEGLAAMKQLVDQDIPILATAIYQPAQALLAALVGASYIAPYVGRMLDSGIDAYAALKSMITMYRQYGFKTKILGAGLKTVEQIHLFAEMGIDAITLKHSLFNQWIANDPHTMNSLKEFAEAWESKDRSDRESTLVL